MADTTTEKWETLVAKKRALTAEKIPQEWRLPASTLEGLNEKSTESVLDIPRECGILSSNEIELTEKYDAVDLLEQLASGAITSSAVITAFSKRAAIAQQLTSCLTETFFDVAIARAKYLDEYLAREGKPIGPLHGLPISIKDSFKIPGVQATIGFVAFLSRPVDDEYSPLPKLLLDLGAILYVKTNIPQTLMTADSDNNIFGRVLNPHKLSLTAGGSSGGEGALIALRGSILGVGTDIGGSIRIPALCCGTFGFKPSSNRVPYGGQVGPARTGSPGILAAAGPLSTSFRDLQLFMDNVIQKEPWEYDSTASAVRWRKLSSPKKTLKIGVLPEDPKFPLHPPVARALESAVAKLKEAGHTLVDLKNSPPVSISNSIAIDLFSLDPKKTPYGIIAQSGEPTVQSVLIDALNSKRVDPYTLSELFDLNTAKAAYVKAWHSVWVEEKIDVIIGPGAETTAVPHDTYGNAPYTMVWNLLDYPGVIIPFGKADKTIDLETKFKSGGARSYSAEAVDGAPTSIQLVSRNLFDEELLEAASIVSEILS